MWGRVHGVRVTCVCDTCAHRLYLHTDLSSRRPPFSQPCQRLSGLPAPSLRGCAHCRNRAGRSGLLSSGRGSSQRPGRWPSGPTGLPAARRGGCSLVGPEPGRAGTGQTDSGRLGGVLRGSRDSCYFGPPCLPPSLLLAAWTVPGLGCRALDQADGEASEGAARAGTHRPHVRPTPASLSRGLDLSKVGNPTLQGSPGGRRWATPHSSLNTLSPNHTPGARGVGVAHGMKPPAQHQVKEHSLPLPCIRRSDRGPRAGGPGRGDGGGALHSACLGSCCSQACICSRCV